MTAHDHSAAPGRRPPSLLEQGPWALRWRETKVALLQAERLLRWAAQPARWPAPQVGSDADVGPYAHLAPGTEVPDGQVTGPFYTSVAADR